MATYTQYYNLKKPAADDYVDVADLNGNFDAIDEAIHNAAQSGGSATGMIETSVESSETSGHAYAVGEHFIYNDTLYVATAAISIGDTITPDTNCVAVTIAEEIEELRRRGDVVDGYYYDGDFYREPAHTTLIAPDAEKLYIDVPTNSFYQWRSTQYVRLSDGSKAEAAIIATVENAESSANAYAIGDMFILFGFLYEATTAIEIGDTIVPGTNCVAVTLDGKMKSTAQSDQAYHLGFYIDADGDLCQA